MSGQVARVSSKAVVGDCASLFPHHGVAAQANWVGAEAVPGYALVLTTTTGSTTTVGVFRTNARTPVKAVQFNSADLEGHTAHSSAVDVGGDSKSNGGDPSSETTGFRSFVAELLDLSAPQTFGDEQFTLPQWELYHSDGLRKVQTIQQFCGGDATVSTKKPRQEFPAADGHSTGETTTVGVFLFFQAGCFIWPAIRNGFRRRITISDGSKYELVTLSTRLVCELFVLCWGSASTLCSAPRQRKR